MHAYFFIILTVIIMTFMEQLLFSSLYTIDRVSFRNFVKGGGANTTIPELRGGAKTIVCFSIREEGRCAR